MIQVWAVLSSVIAFLFTLTPKFSQSVDLSSVSFAPQAQVDMEWVIPVTQTWRGYKENYIFCGENCGNNSGLVYDPSANYQAVSEGVGYAMLMSVMMGDRYTFNQVYDAAHEILLNRATGLFHWKVNNQGRIIGFGSATDSELDIAVSLIFAQSRVNRGEWQQYEERPYGERATELLDSIWEFEVVDGRYLKPGDTFEGEGLDIINLSYFSPAWFRIFNRFESSNRWTPLIDQGYDSLYSTAGSPLGLAPDWSTADGEPAFAYCNAHNLDPGNCLYEMRYDAIRVPWRIGVDCLWFGEPRACEWSRRTADFLNSLPPDQFARMYDMQGNVIVDYQDLAMISMWTVAAKASGDEALLDRLASMLLEQAEDVNNTLYWGDSPEFYYNQSLAWFAASLLAGTFRNLSDA